MNITYVIICVLLLTFKLIIIEKAGVRDMLAWSEFQ